MTEFQKILAIVNGDEEEVGIEGDDPSYPKDKRDKELYILWASIPNIIRRLNEVELLKMGYPIDDPVFKKMIDAFSQNQFCMAFGVGKNRPTFWKKNDPELETRITQLSEKTNVLRFEKDVDLAFTQKTIQHGDASRVKLWKQLYKGWSEKSAVVHSGKVTTLHELITELEKDD